MVQGVRHMFMRCLPVLLSFLFYILDFWVKICLENKVCSREYLGIHRSKADTISKVDMHASRVLQWSSELSFGSPAVWLAI